MDDPLDMPFSRDKESENRPPGLSFIFGSGVSDANCIVVAEMLPVDCLICHGARWACEAHPALPWGGASDHSDACHCGGAGMPCPVCNWSPDRERPEMPEGYMSFLEEESQD